MPELLQLRYKHFSPPGQKWFYICPGTGAYFESLQSMHDLEEMVRRHYWANESLVMPSDLSALIEDHMCRELPPGLCIGKDDRDPSTLRLTFFEVIEATEKFFRGQKRALATLPEAERRASICVKCSENSRGMCTSCNRLQMTARQFVAQRKLQIDSQLGVCKVLRIPVNAVVHVGVIPSSVKFPQGCWVTEVSNGDQTSTA